MMLGFSGVGKKSLIKRISLNSFDTYHPKEDLSEVFAVTFHNQVPFASFRFLSCFDENFVSLRAK